MSSTHPSWLGWRKSSYSSGGEGNCVELAMEKTAGAVRDSKNPDGPVISLPMRSFQAFLRNVKGNN